MAKPPLSRAKLAVMLTVSTMVLIGFVFVGSDERGTETIQLELESSDLEVPPSTLPHPIKDTAALENVKVAAIHQAAMAAQGWLHLLGHTTLTRAELRGAVVSARKHIQELSALGAHAEVGDMQRTIKMVLTSAREKHPELLTSSNADKDLNSDVVRTNSAIHAVAAQEQVDAIAAEVDWEESHADTGSEEPKTAPVGASPEALEARGEELLGLGHGGPPGGGEPIVGAPPTGGWPHGCVGDGGYTWCAAKSKCVRPWEEAAGSPCATPPAPGAAPTPPTPLVPVTIVPAPTPPLNLDAISFESNGSKDTEEYLAALLKVKQLLLKKRALVSTRAVKAANEAVYEDKSETAMTKLDEATAAAVDKYKIDVALAEDAKNRKAAEAMTSQANKIYQNKAKTLTNSTQYLDKLANKASAAVKRVNKVAATLEKRHAELKKQIKAKEEEVTSQEESVSDKVKDEVAVLAYATKKMREVFQSKKQGYGGAGGKWMVRVAERTSQLAKDLNITDSPVEEKKVEKAHKTAPATHDVPTMPVSGTPPTVVQTSMAKPLKSEILMGGQKVSPQEAEDEDEDDSLFGAPSMSVMEATLSAKETHPTMTLRGNHVQDQDQDMVILKGNQIPPPERAANDLTSLSLDQALSMMRLGGDEKLLSYQGERHMHRFPSTLSVFEKLHLKSPTRMHAAKAIATRLQHLATSLCNHGACPTSLLCGEDKRYRLPLDTPQFNAQVVEVALTKLESSQLLPADEAKSLRLLAKAASAGDAAAVTALKQASELLQKIKWSANEVSLGVKLLKGGKRLELHDALYGGGTLRLELISSFQGKLQQLEGTYDLTYGSQREAPPKQLTTSLKNYKSKLLNAVKLNVAEAHPMVAAHRLWSLAVLDADEPLRKALEPVLSSREAALTQVENVINLMLAVLQRKDLTLIGSVVKEVQDMQGLLASSLPGKETAVQLEDINVMYHRYLKTSHLDVARIKNVLAAVHKKLEATVAIQAKKLLKALPLAEMPLNPVMVDTHVSAHRTRHLPYRGALPAPKVVTAELPEAAWANSMRPASAKSSE